jgi:hypothetical protein
MAIILVDVPKSKRATIPRRWNSGIVSFPWTPVVNLRWCRKHH